MQPLNLPALALWYERNNNHDFADKRPTVELHVNLWRRIGHRRGENEINYLDLGIRILEHRDLGSLKLYVPFFREHCEIVDLGDLLRQRDIASAVFNEVLEVVGGEDASQRTFSIRKDKKHFLSVHSIDVEKDISNIYPLSEDESNGFVIQLSSEFCTKFQSPGDHYIRFRFKLKSEAARVFSEDVSNEDGFILSSITSSEITEIRINEVRSIPEEAQLIVKKYEWQVPEISAIHYFLVRDISFDLIASHASFRKIRRMEPEWDAYLGDEFPQGSARGMLIYHWRKAGDGGDVGDFVTLAKFRRSKNNVALYIFLVIVLGSIGSGIHASFSWFIREYVGAGAFAIDWWGILHQRLRCAIESAGQSSWWDLIFLRPRCGELPSGLGWSDIISPRNGSEVVGATVGLVLLVVGIVVFVAWWRKVWRKLSDKILSMWSWKK